MLLMFFHHLIVLELKHYLLVNDQFLLWNKLSHNWILDGYVSFLQQKESI